MHLVGFVIRKQFSFDVSHTWDKSARLTSIYQSSPTPNNQSHIQPPDSVHGLILKTYIYIQGVYKRMVRFQKVTRNLFLTLHGHNVNRQQWKLSKFLMRYQQFVSHA